MAKRTLYMPDKFEGRLRQLLADKGVSTKQAQRDLKVSSSTMYAWLNDERIMSVVNFFEHTAHNLPRTVVVSEGKHVDAVRGAGAAEITHLLDQRHTGAGARRADSGAEARRAAAANKHIVPPAVGKEYGQAICILTLS